MATAQAQFTDPTFQPYSDAPPPPGQVWVSIAGTATTASGVEYDASAGRLNCGHYRVEHSSSSQWDFVDEKVRCTVCDPDGFHMEHFVDILRSVLR